MRCADFVAKVILHSRSKILWAVDAFFDSICEGTSSHSDELTGDFGNEPEAISIGDHDLARLLAEKLLPRDLRLLQQNRHLATDRRAAISWQRLGVDRTRRGHAESVENDPQQKCAPEVVYFFFAARFFDRGCSPRTNSSL